MEHSGWFGKPPQADALEPSKPGVLTAFCHVRIRSLIKHPSRVCIFLNLLFEASSNHRASIPIIPLILPLLFFIISSHKPNRNTSLSSPPPHAPARRFFPSDFDFEVPRQLTLAARHGAPLGEGAASGA